MMANQNILVASLNGAATTVVGADIDNLSGVFGHVVIDVTAITGTVPMLTVTVEGKDQNTGKYYTILVSAAISTVSTTVLRIFPGAVAAANVTANDFVPRTFRVTAAVAGTTPVVTGKISVNLNG